MNITFLRMTILLKFHTGCGYNNGNGIDQIDRICYTHGYGYELGFGDGYTEGAGCKGIMQKWI